MDVAQLEEWSLTAVVTAGVIFGLAFVFYAYDFAVRWSGRQSARTHKAVNIGTALTWLGFLVITAGAVLRGCRRDACRGRTCTSSRSRRWRSSPACTCS